MTFVTTYMTRKTSIEMFYPEDNRDPIGQICFHFQRYLTSHWVIALYQFWLNVQLVVPCRGMLVPRNSIVERCVDYNIMIPGFDCDSDTGKTQAKLRQNSLWQI